MPDDLDIYAVSGVSNAVKLLGNTSIPFKPSELKANYTELCKLSWQQVKDKYLEKLEEKYLKNMCFLGIYSSSLLMEGYKIPSDKLIRSPSKINTVSPSWLLGATFY